MSAAKEQKSVKSVEDAPVDMRWLNAAGQEPAKIVLDVMKEYGIEHGPLDFVDKGTWVHESETSACVAVETTERAATVIEFGPTAEYGQTLRAEGVHYLHVFYLTGLKPDTTYHYRVSGVTRADAEGTGKDATFTTRTIPDVVRIPQDVQGPAYKLDKADTYYLLTEDVVAPASAFEISASGVTLDLGGRTVVYNEEHLGLPTDSRNMMIKKSAFGVRARARDLKNVRILNGTILQGKGNDEGSYTAMGFNPIYMSGGTQSELAGLTCIYGGPQMSGIVLHWAGPKITIHHNVVEDLGKLITDRHKCCSAISFPSESGKCYNNLIRRTRQFGVGHVSKSNIESHSNEVYVESTSVNGGGVGSGPGGYVHDNKIFGYGNNVVAIATTGGKSRGIRLHNNYIWLHAHDISHLHKHQRLNTDTHEATPYSTMSGARITWGCNGVDYRGNTFLITGREEGRLRGTFFYGDINSRGAVFADNTVIALAEDDKTTRAGAIGGVGDNSRGPAVPILFENNTIISNFANFSMQDTYGTSHNYLFVRNTFVRVGDNPIYATIRGGRGFASTGHVFIDSEFVGGAGYDKLLMADYDGQPNPAADRPGDNFTVQWTLDLSAPAGADVTITDSTGEEVFTGRVGADGLLATPLTEYSWTGGEKTPMTPHQVSVTAGGKTETVSVTMDAKKDLKVKA